MERKGNWHDGDWMMTASGRHFWPEDPRPKDLAIEDIAHGLANQIRFGGQINQRYTVAQHSVNVLELVVERYLSTSCGLYIDWPKIQMAALLHDGAEAFLGDMPTPVKRGLPDYKKMESMTMAAIEKRWDCAVSADEKRIIKDADLNMLTVEAQRFYGKKTTASWELMPPTSSATALIGRQNVWGFEVAKNAFLVNFENLRKIRKQKR